jgi:hypothetical protein
MKPTLTLLTALLLAPLAALPAAQAPVAAAVGAWRSYEVYEPVIERYFPRRPRVCLADT